MLATIMYGAGDVRTEEVPDAALTEPTDALVRVTRACVCGSDLWPYASMERSESGQSMGHEAIGVVEEVGADVRSVKRGDVVVMPFAFSDGTCAFCHEGLHTACEHVGFFGNNGMNGAQAEALGVPFADGTLFPLPVGEDDGDELLPDILEGRIEPGKVFDRTVGLGEVPDGYRAMAGRDSIKVMVRP